MFGSLCQHIRSWIDVSIVDPYNLRDHFIQFTHYLGGLKARQSFLQLIWLLCIWLVWNDRNNRLFNNIQTHIIELMDKVKYNYYWWLKTNNIAFVYGSQRWWSGSLLCLGIG